MYTMPDIEHPIITATERWGYPERPREITISCAYCNKKLTGGDTVFNWDGDRICENCCRSAIEENLTFLEIAEALDIAADRVADLEDRDE